MGRLTSESGFCETIGCKTCEKLNTYGCYEDEVYKKLREYEDAEEQGLLLRFPCKVGTKVYLIRCDSVEVIKCAVARFIIGDQVKNVRLYIIKDDRYTEVPLYQFNKTVFLTKEEAEQALVRMEGENEV